MKINVLIPLIGIFLLFCLKEMNAQTDPEAEKLYQVLVDDDCISAKLLAQSVKNVNYIGNSGISLLSQSCHCLEVAKILLERGANVNLQNHEGRTALMEASRSGSTEIVKLLLKKGANPNLLDKIGSFALMKCVCGKGNAEIVRLLLDNGANPNIQFDGFTALDFASSIYGQEEVVELLKKSSVHNDSNIQKDINTSLYYDPNWNGNSWFDKYTKYKALYEGDSEELVCNLRNKKYSEDFAKNIKKIILCNYVVDLNSGSKEAKYYESIISEARKDLIKKGYEVEVVWYNKSESQYKNSETIKKKPAREEVAIVEISAGCDSSSKKYSGTTNETVGVVKDSNGKTVAEYQAPSSYSYREYTYTTEVHMWVRPYYQRTAVQGFGYSYQSLRGYVFTRSLKWLLKDIPKRK